MSQERVIGMVGGMGTQATIHAFKQYADVFPAVKEWDRPRMIIDNKCTMPSRVKAYFEHDQEDLLVQQLHDSIKMLKTSGATDIFLACNTSHLFIDQIKQLDPSIFDGIHFYNMIEIVCKKIAEKKVKRVFLLATEGTIDSRIYHKELEKYGIECVAPDEKYYPMIRKCIEDVKQDHYDGMTLKILKAFVDEPVVLFGCTEFPVLYHRYRSMFQDVTIFDPVYETLMEMKKDMEHGVVLTFGVYDYFHLGHLRLFKQAKQYGDSLTVAVQEEEWIKKFKPQAKVLYSTKERMEMISSLKMVDKVITYTEMTPEALEKIDFEILALGEDHVGERFDRLITWCNAHDKKVVRLKRTPGICSSEIKKTL